jgi:hypothetical protein
MEFHTCVAPVRALFSQQLGNGALRIRHGDVLGTLDRAGNLHGNFALAESRHIVMLRRARVVFVRAAAAQMQFEFVVAGVGDDLRVLRDGHVGGGGWAGGRKEDTAPARRCGFDILHV